MIVVLIAYTQYFMNLIERIDKPCEYIGVVQTGVIALQYLYIWLFGGSDDAYRVYAMATLMAFEFIMVHSGIIMSAVPRKYSVLVFFPFYGLFAYAFHQMMREGDYTVMIIYLTVVLNRMRFAFFNVGREIKLRSVMISFIAASCYLLIMTVVAAVQDFIPAFALGESLTSSVAYREAAAGTGGLFTEKPCTAICFGFLYYSLLSYVNYRIVRGTLFIPEISEKTNTFV